jgi:hypothetical protein
VSVVLLALHYLWTTGATDVPTNKGRMVIWAFEELPKAVIEGEWLGLVEYITEGAFVG